MPKEIRPIGRVGVSVRTNRGLLRSAHRHRDLGVLVGALNLHALAENALGGTLLNCVRGKARARVHPIGALPVNGDLHRLNRRRRDILRKRWQHEGLTDGAARYRNGGDVCGIQPARKHRARIVDQRRAEQPIAALMAWITAVHQIIAAGVSGGMPQPRSARVGSAKYFELVPEFVRPSSPAHL